MGWGTQMKNSMILAGTLAAILGGTAAALAATHTINLSANVPIVCTLPSLPTNSGQGFSSAGAGASNFSVHMTGGNVDLTAGKLIFTGVSCNGNTTIALSRGGKLRRGGNSAASDSINYTAIANWKHEDVIMLTDETQTHGEYDISAGTGDLTIDIQVDAVTTGLFNGSYSDTLTLTVGQVI
jgi:hypothetical protein